MSTGLLTRERPAVTEVVAWAASNGDRSENADYQYGKRRLRQIDGRIRFLTMPAPIRDAKQCGFAMLLEAKGWRLCG
jgi:hypothetical protein